MNMLKHKFNACWTVKAFWPKKRMDAYHLLFQCNNAGEVSIASLIDDAEQIREIVSVTDSTIKITPRTVMVEVPYIGNLLESLVTFQDITVYPA